MHCDSGTLCNIGYPSKTYLKTNSCEILFANHRERECCSTVPAKKKRIAKARINIHSLEESTRHQKGPVIERCFHDDVIKSKHFPRYWPFVWGIRRSLMKSPYKDQWRGALMFSLICAWIHGWVNNREAGDLRRHRVHYDVNVMPCRGITLLPISVKK